MNNASIILKNHADELLNALTKLGTAPFDDIFTIDINCAQLAAYESGCHGSAESSRIISTLHAHTGSAGPAVYWYEIISDHSATQIREHFETLKEAMGHRKLPATKKNYEKGSKVLYVGKGNANISGRMFLHLGYETRHIHLQGLQLCHWDYHGELCSLRLRLNIIFLPMDMTAFAPLFERRLADAFNPILGRHS